MKSKIEKGALALLSFILGVGVSILVLAVVLSVGKVATINDEPLSIGEFYDYIDMRKNALLLDYVEDNIHIAALEELGLTVSTSEVDERFNSIAEDKGGYDAFKEQLEMAGTSVEQYRFNIHKVLLDEKAGEYFTEKQTVSEDEIVAELQKREQEGKPLITIDGRSIELEDGEDAENYDLSKINPDKLTLQRNISTETLFEGVPEKGERTVVNVGGKRTLLVVDEVYTGIDDVNVRGYIREVLKVTKAQSEYQKYINEKVDNAKIMIK